MTRIGHQNLYAGNQTGVVRSPDRTIEYLVVYNNNPAPVYIRLGSPEIPNQRNFDIMVPALQIMALSVNSNQFGFRLGNDDVLPSLISGNTVIEGMIDEAPPVVGNVPIQAASLATADLANGYQTFAGVTTSAIFNLALWGGASLFILPALSSGQSVVAIQSSSDQTNWTTNGTWALLPGVPVVINVNRTAQFFRFIINVTAIAGEPAIGGVYSVRASLSEVQQLAFNPGGNNYVKNYAVTALGSQTFFYVTAGLPAVIVRMNVATGVRQEMVWYTGPTASGPWSLAAFREQSVAGFYNSIYRSLGNLDAFLRIDILDIGNNAGTGTLALAVANAPDLTAVLQNIYAALGDVGQPVNTNQSIYHELESIRSLSASYLPYLPNLASIFSVENANLPFLPNLASINTHEANIDTNIGAVANRIGVGAVVYTGQTSIPSGVWTATGIAINPTYKVASVQVSAAVPGSGSPNTSGLIALGQGTNSTETQSWYTLYPEISVDRSNTNALIQGHYVGPTIQSASIGGPGVLIFNNSTQIWLYQSVNSGTLTMAFTVVAYPP
jgi:hypothetical protein